jgi:hypothetical protein
MKPLNWTTIKAPTHVIVVLRVSKQNRLADSDVTLLTAHFKPFTTASVRRHDTTLKDKRWQHLSADSYSSWTHQKTTLFSGHYLCNPSTLEIGVLGYIGILYHKEHHSEVWHIPLGTPFILVSCSSCENPQQNPFWDTNTATMI